MTLVDDGWRHFADADWQSARDSFAAALAERPGDPDSLDGLGQSLWWLGANDDAVANRRAAYLAYRDRGDVRNAGRIASYLAAEERIAGRAAASVGLAGAGATAARRARRRAGARLARGRGGKGRTRPGGDGDACPGRARDRARAGRPRRRVHGARAPRPGRRRPGPRGRRRRPARRGDDDRAGGRVEDPLAAGETCCTTLIACEGLADIRRSSEWCEAVVEFAQRRRFTPVQSWCRSIYASLLIRGGDWARAEVVLADALQRPANERSRGGRGLPLATLAELRLRQGRAEEAAALIEGLDDDAALAPRVRLALCRGDLDHARAVLDRCRPRLGEPVALVLEAEHARAARDMDALRAVAWSLAELGAAIDRDDLRAEAAHAAGCAAAGGGDTAAAVASLDAAVAGYGALGYPLEEGRARLSLARALAQAGSPLALDTARVARDAFEALGARAEADLAAALLRGLGGAGRSVVRVDAGSLTSRETRGAAAARRGPHERRDRAPARHLAEDGRAPRQPRARQARRAHPHRGGCARRA